MLRIFLLLCFSAAVSLYGQSRPDLAPEQTTSLDDVCFYTQEGTGELRKVCVGTLKNLFGVRSINIGYVPGLTGNPIADRNTIAQDPNGDVWLLDADGKGKKLSLTGPAGSDGIDGQSAYEIAVANGYVGDEVSWLASLEGDQGIDGNDGTDGVGISDVTLNADSTLTFDFTDASTYTTPLRIVGRDGSFKESSVFVSAKFYGAKGDSVTNDKDAVLDAIAVADSLGSRFVYFPRGDYVLTGFTRSMQRQVILVGEGRVVDGEYGVDIHSLLSNDDYQLINSIPQSQLVALNEAISLTGTAKVTLAGTSISGENQGSGALDSYGHAIKRALIAAYGPGVIQFKFRGIGGEQVLDFAGIRQPNSFPSWFVPTTEKWYQVVLNENPDLLFMGFVMNDIGFDPATAAAYVSVVDSIQQHSKVPGIVFVTAPPPSFDTSFNVIETNTELAQESRNTTSAFLHDFARANNFGLIDFNRAGTIARDGKDYRHTVSDGPYGFPTQQLENGPNQPWILPATYNGFSLKFNVDAARLNPNTEGRSGGYFTVRLGAFNNDFLWLENTGSNFRIRLYSQASPTSSLSIDQIPGAPLTGVNTYRVTKKNNVLQLQINSQVVWERQDYYAGGSGLFQPQVYIYNGTSSEAIIVNQIEYYKHLPKRYLPTLTDDEFWGISDGTSTDFKPVFGGNGKNHPGHLSQEQVYSKSVEATIFTYVPSASSSDDQTSSEVPTETNVSEPNVQLALEARPTQLELDPQFSANSTSDRSRANHTGTQPVSSITGIQLSIAGKNLLISNGVGVNLDPLAPWNRSGTLIHYANNAVFGSDQLSGFSGRLVGIYSGSGNTRFLLKNAASGQDAGDGYELGYTTSLVAEYNNREGAGHSFLGGNVNFSNNIILPAGYLSPGTSAQGIRFTSNYVDVWNASASGTVQRWGNLGGFVSMRINADNTFNLYNAGRGISTSSNQTHIGLSTRLFSFTDDGVLDFPATITDPTPFSGGMAYNSSTGRYIVGSNTLDTVAFVSDFDLSSTTISATTTISTTSEMVFVSASTGNVTINLPPASLWAGKQIRIKRTDASANTVNVDASGPEEIDGASAVGLSSLQTVNLTSDGSSIWIIN